MSNSMTIECQVHFSTEKKGAKKQIVSGPAPESPTGRLQRVTKLLALAIRFERLLKEGAVTDYAEVARLGHVTRARITQIMNLLLLAPDLQEEILFLPRVTGGRDPVCLRELQAIALEPDWKRQRAAWQDLSVS